MTTQRSLLIFLVASVAAATLAMPVPVETSANVLPALALTIFTVGLWATGALPEFITAMVFFILALGFSVAPPEVIFSGLRSSAFWLVVGGVVIGVAAERTGLGRYLAHFFTRRLNASYFQLIAGIVVGAVTLAFLIPSSMGRLVILMPIILGLADNLGFEPGSKGRTGITLAATFGTFYVPLTILPANLPNVVLAGVSDTLYDLSITYGVYLLMNFPVIGVIKGGFLITMIWFMFREDIPNATKRNDEPLKLHSDGRRLAMILSIALIAWVTDFAHGVAPGFVAMGAAFCCMFPGIRVIRLGDMKTSGGYQTLLYVIAILGVGAVISNSGAGTFIADEILKVVHFAPGETVHTYAAFSGLSMVFSLFATLPGAITIVAPFAGQVADSSGLPLIAVLMMIVNGFSTLFLPYQSAPIMVGLRLGNVSLTTATRVMLPLAVITIVLLLPLNFLWWQWLGFLP
ncbi:MAG: anion permease [Rhodospirillales bacterium]|nr:anion permease [Rhodospirillales bacterium]